MVEQPYQPLKFNQRLTGHDGAVFGLYSGPESPLLYTCGGDGWLVAWDLRQPDPGRLIARVPVQAFSLTGLPQDGQFVIGDMNGGMHWIDLQHPERNKDIAHHTRGVFSLIVRDESLYSSGGDGRISRWSIEEQRPVESWQISLRSVRVMTFHPHLTLLACAGSDGCITIRTLPSMKELFRIPDAHLPSVFSLCFSPDGNHLWSGGRDARLKCWSMEKEGEAVFDLSAHWYSINALAYDPGRGVLASASRDKTIRIWDMRSGELLQSLETVRDLGHRHSVNNLLWSAFNGQLISVSDDRSIILWD